MRILFVDAVTTGHHMVYMKELINDGRYESVVLAPDDDMIKNAGFGGNTTVVPMTGGSYGQRLEQIRKTADEYKVDIIHLLFADSIMKYYGFGLGRLKQYRIAATFHQFRYSFLRNIARKLLFAKVDRGVVHTESMLRYLEGNNIKNAVHIEYPKFERVEYCDKETAKKRLGIETDKPVLLALGGTRYDKGLDILLHALNKAEQPFYLLVAGKPEAFDEAFIRSEGARFADAMKLILRFLTDEEMALCSSACDIAVLPYRMSFDGASGGLVDAVVAGKPVIGAGHGALGELIRNNHLGYTFKTEDPDDLARVIDKALSEGFLQDDTAERYRKSLDPQSFRSKYYKLYDELTEK